MVVKIVINTIESSNYTVGKYENISENMYFPKKNKYPENP